MKFISIVFVMCGTLVLFSCSEKTKENTAEVRAEVVEHQSYNIVHNLMTYRLSGTEEKKPSFVDDIRLQIGESEIVHIGNSKETTINDLARLMMDLFGERFELKECGGLSGSVSRRCPDTSKLKKLTGFEAKVDFPTPSTPYNKTVTGFIFFPVVTSFNKLIYSPFSICLNSYSVPLALFISE